MFDHDDLDEFGFRRSSLKSKAAAMYRQGATRLQVHEALGEPMLNVLSEVEAMGYKIVRKKVRIGFNRPHYRYTIADKVEISNEQDGSTD